LFSKKSGYQFGKNQYATRQPECLAANAAVEPIEQIKPIHLH
jgi:hypothetical protein